MPMAMSVLNLPLPPRRSVIISGGTSALTAELMRSAMEKYFKIYFELATTSCSKVLFDVPRENVSAVCSRNMCVKNFAVSIPPNTPNMNADTVRAMAISIPIWEAVRKNTVGFINGEESINAITALKGRPAVKSDRPMGMAAYVGSGETMPASAATTMERYSFERRLMSNSRCVRKKRAATILSAMLMMT